MEGEKLSVIWLRETPGAPPPDPWRPTMVSLVFENNLIDARDFDRWFDDAIYALGKGHATVVNNCFWGGRYNQPIYMNQLRVSEVDLSSSLANTDYFIEGNYFNYQLQYQLQGPEKATPPCSLKRQSQPEICVAMFNGTIDICASRWGDELGL